MTGEELERDPGLRQRILEGWLPLAQEASASYGWDLEAAALEALILSAAPALRQARTVFEARAMLRGAYRHLRHEGDR